MNSEIKVYYKQKEPLIHKSIAELFPKTCTDQWLKELTGRNELSWDTHTLQLAFLNPIHSYHKRRETFFYSLGGILFLESAGIDPEKYLPLIGISEAFESCFRLFKEVAMFNPENEGSVNGLPIQDAIKANIGVALLTLPYYPLLYNTFDLSPEIRLTLFQNATKYVSRVLYANGANLYRKKNKIHFKQFNEYAQTAYYLHSPKLQFNLDLWLYLSDNCHSTEVTRHCEVLVRHFSVLYNLLFDLRLFNTWIENIESRYIEFDSVNSFILLQLSNALGIENVYKETLSRDRILKMYDQSGTDRFIKQKISNSQESLNHQIDELPFAIEQRNRIKDYCQLLLDTKD